MSETAAASTATSSAVRGALDVLLYDDPQGPKKRKVIVELQTLVQKSDFAEQFLEEDGLNVILQQVKQTSGNVQGALLVVLKHLLVYVNAIDQVAESPDLVDKIYGLLVPSSDGTPVSLSVAKPTLEILIVIIGVLEKGHKIVNQAAKKRVGVGIQPYSPLIPLLSCEEYTTIHNTLVFMNILLKKKKASSDLKAKKLFFRWKECGIISLLQRISSVEDEDIQKQLSLLQKQASFTIPRSWEEASKYKLQFEEARRKCDLATDALFVYQQQQARMRLLKVELQRAQETIRALGIVLPSSSTNYHPSRRFRDGGGLAAGALVSTALEPIDSTQASKEISDIRKKVFEHFIASSDFKPMAQKIIGFAPGGGGGGGARGGAGRRYDDMSGPPPNDDDEDLPPPSDEDEPPPPSDDDADGPPPSDDENDPTPSGARGGGGGGRKGGGHKKGGGSGGNNTNNNGGHGGSSAAVGADGQPLQSSTTGAAVVVPGAPAAARLGEANADTYEATQTAAHADSAVAVAVAPAAVAAPVASPTYAAAPSGGGPPPPPPPPGRKGGPPPPPGRAVAGAAAPKDTRIFFRGPAPQKKMKPLHWDKVDLLPSGDSLWHRIYAGTDIDCAFDYEEFENLFSQKEAEKKEVAVKAKKIMLLEEGIHRNLSIVLHKLPSIPNVQRALLELDTQVLNREALVAMSAQAPTPEVKKAFLSNATKKPEDEYEPPEKYMAMMVTMPEFQKRVLAWLFTMEWSDSTSAVTKPIQRLTEAINAMLESKSLPYYFGLLLGFGNMMNFGDVRKGNAPAMSLALLSKLELTKDNRGKTSLVGHLINTVKLRNPDALNVAEELKCLTSNLMQIKWEDIDKSVKEAEAAVQIFKNQCADVKKKLIETGSDKEDPFIPITTEFYGQAFAELGAIQADFEKLKEANFRLLAYFGIADVKKKPEDIFVELVPFLDKIRKAAQDVAKDSRRNAKKGQKLGDGQSLSDVVGKLQEQIAN